MRIRDVAAFRAWVNDYFKSRGLPVGDAYPTEEAIVADYVSRGLTYFALDYVELEKETRFIDPVAYRFKSAELYYPLVTSNSFGGNGAIELFVVAPVTLCRPGSNDIRAYFNQENYDLAVTIPGQPDRMCLGIKTKASTSARLPVEERDLDAIYSGWEEFFAGSPMFLQAFRHVGDYHFTGDIFAPEIGEGKALKGEESTRDPLARLRDIALPETCHLKPAGGRCKGNFDAYYFDAAAGACKWFSYGGCGGVVPFQTKEDCEKSCLPKN